MLIAQITDTHIKPRGRLAYRRVDTAAYLADAVAHLNAQDPAPDVVLATGDMVDAGTAEEYGLLGEILAPLKAPVFLIPGNHDARGAMAAGFPRHRYLPRDGLLNYAIEDFPVRLVALDTLVEGESGGTLERAHFAWLDRTLGDRPGAPTIVFMHHPPFRTGIAHMDRIGLRGAAELEAIVARHPQVERVLCGHLHRPIQVRFGGTIASTAPSTAHQVALDLSPDGPSAFVMEPPGYQLHRWSDATGLVSHTAVIGSYAGPYPFHEESGGLID